MNAESRAESWPKVKEGSLAPTSPSTPLVVATIEAPARSPAWGSSPELRQKRYILEEMWEVVFLVQEVVSI